MKRLLSSLLGALALLAVALPTPESAAQTGIGEEPPGFHGMLVVGSRHIYISHLPMFMPQHRYQAIWEVSFGAAGDAAYRAEWARPDNAGGIFTLAPRELFRLPELTTTRDSFIADVYVGHFERPGHRKLLEGVTVTLQRPVHWHPFVTGDRRPEALTYLLFGEGGELFLAHWISTAPDYDQILAVELSAPLGAVPPGTQFVVVEQGDEEPLEAGAAVAGLMVRATGPGAPVELRPVTLTVRSEYYFEEGELSFTELATR